MSFPSLNPALDRALAAQGYLEPTPVQRAVLEADAGADLLVSAQTGSGKTVAYGLGFARTLLGDAEKFGKPGAPLCLIVAPTRELALQVFSELTWLYAQTGAKLVSCVGGMDPRREKFALMDGAHIVVGTPGRLKDHLERGNLDTSALQVVVLDEADEMLDLGFREDLEFILDASPTDRRTLLFSATIARDIATLARRYQNDALRIDTLVRNESHGDIDHRAMVIAPNDLENAVVNVLRLFEARAALVFCGTREAVRHLHASLNERGFSAVALSGELSQNERSHALQALRDGRSRVCVATDVAARGLDLPNLELVIHADLPQNRAALLHRSGRTGRAGRKGTSVLLAPINRRRKAEMLISSAGVDVTWSGPPTAEAIRKRDQERMLEDPILAGELSPEDAVLATALLEGRSAEQVAAALIRLYRQRLPEPEELFDGAFRPGSAPVRGERGERPERREREPYDPDRPRPERGPRPGSEGAVWFRLNVGREKNADPKWLIPLICRQGHVTKQDIGLIKIFDRDTRFEILAENAARFAETIKSMPDSGGVKISPADEPFAKSSPPRDRPVRDHAPRDHAPREHTPRDADAPVEKLPRKYEGRVEGQAAATDAPRAYDKPKFDKPKFDKPKFKPKFDGPKADGAAGEKPAWTPKDKPFAKGPKPAFGDKPPFKKAGKVDKNKGKPKFKDKPAKPKTTWTP
jgi:ATP-dependent RNA helicase DeaD